MERYPPSRPGRAHHAETVNISGCAEPATDDELGRHVAHCSQEVQEG